MFVQTKSNKIYEYFLEYKWFPDRCDKPLHFNLIFVNVGCEDSFLYLSICWLYDRYTSYLSPETLWRNKPLEIHAKILHYTAIVRNKTVLLQKQQKPSYFSSLLWSKQMLSGLTF